MKYLSYVLAAVLSLSGLAIAGIPAPVSVSVPTFTPWGTIITAAVFGVSGIYTILRKRK